MDDLLLALFQGPNFSLTVLLFGVLALVFAGYAVRGLVTGRMGSGDRTILRADGPRRFRRSLLGTGALALLLLALAASAYAWLADFEIWLRIGMPLIWLLALTLAWRRGGLAGWSRAERPRAFWTCVALFAFAFTVSCFVALQEIARLR